MNLDFDPSAVTQMKKATGFTLIEMAIVLIIAGVLMGGVLKGQALINTAKTHSTMSDIKSIQAAYLSFVNQYHHVPGDWDQAARHIPGAVDCDAQCNTGRIDTTRKSVLAFNQLSAAGLISGGFNGVGAQNTPENSPTNGWGGAMQLIADAQYQGANGVARLHLNTGAMMPVSVMERLDTELDDGLPAAGPLRYSAWSHAGSADTNGCIQTAGAVTNWRSGADPASDNCGGAYFLE